jgi:hypothetical protein
MKGDSDQMSIKSRFQYQKGQIYNQIGFGCIAFTLIFYPIYGQLNARHLNFLTYIIEALCILAAVAVPVLMFRIRRTDIQISLTSVIVTRPWTKCEIPLHDVCRFGFVRSFSKVTYAVAAIGKDGVMLARSSLLTPNGVLESRQNGGIKKLVLLMDEELRLKQDASRRSYRRQVPD